MKFIILVGILFSNISLAAKTIYSAANHIGFSNTQEVKPFVADKT